MDTPICHIDVGVTMGQASVLGCKPTIEILCERTDGGRIWDDYIQLQLTGKPPAACNCPDCIGIAKIMYESDCGFVKARALYRRQMRLRRREGQADRAPGWWVQERERGRILLCEVGE